MVSICISLVRIDVEKVFTPLYWLFQYCFICLLLYNTSLPKEMLNTTILSMVTSDELNFNEVSILITLRSVLFVFVIFDILLYFLLKAIFYILHLELSLP